MGTRAGGPSPVPEGEGTEAERRGGGGRGAVGFPPVASASSVQ